ncbi:MAG: MFS transporter [Gemmataceae bacterium]|nr:MFS transporter [Gemmataceae bacterium]
MSRPEWALLLVLVAVQFTHMVDFVIIMPLGKRLMHELDISPSQFGYVVAAYAWAAGVASLLASFVMDRFDRRAVLLTMYAGFGLSTLFCGLADSYELLLVSRTLAGVFGGVAAVALMAVIGDVFPPEKRGRATGAVISSFAVASIAGLPLGLWLARWQGWGAPFVALAGLSAVVWVVGWVRLPPVRGHLAAARRDPLREFAAVAREPNHLWGFAFSFFLVLGTFTVASFVAPVLASTNGWDEGQLATIYLFAGLLTFLGTNLVGRLADRVPRLPLFRVLAGLATMLALVLTHLPAVPLWVAAAAVGGFMVAAAGRMVPAQAMMLGAAAPRVRGAFMSLNTAVQHLATGLAPTIAGLIIAEGPDGRLTGFGLVGWVGAATAVASLGLAGKLKPVPQGAVQALPEVTAEPARELELDETAEPAAVA